jgi:hypothetical protein
LSGLVELELVAVGDIACATLCVFEDTIIEIKDEDTFAIA